MLGSAWLIALFAFEAPSSSPRTARGLGSFTALISLLFAGLALLECALGQRRRARFLLAGAGTLLTGYGLVNTWALSLTSISLGHLLEHLFSAPSPSRHLSEAGVEPSTVALGTLALAATFFLGGLANARLPRLLIGPRALRVVAAIWIGSLAVFVAEQASRPPGYIERGLSLPLYVQLFDSRVAPVEVVARPSAPPTTLGAPKNPNHVLLIVLESFRADLLKRPDLVPNLRALAARGIECTEGYTQATDTHLSWQALFLQRPAFQRIGAPTGAGAPVLQLFKQAGYQIVIVSSTTLEWYDFDQRLQGAGGVVDRLTDFKVAAGARHLADAQATDALLGVIAQLGSTPTLMILQLDATHFGYDFAREAAVVEPHLSETGFTPLPYTADEIDLLAARYFNAANQVDRQLGRVLDAVEARGLTERTAVVVVSDHGEDFAPGRVGHAAVTQATKRIPLLLALPGEPARREARTVSTPDVWPTLCEHLGIEVVGTLCGESILSPTVRAEGVLTYSALSQRAHYTRPSEVIEFYAERVGADRLRLHPIGVVDRSGAPIPDWQSHLETNSAWRRELRDRFPGGVY
ncbi:MAG: sulfatase-like hydrolase/transferase [Planctomycetes bacterium]|nr:sulfatase-like hydrolase/transferase [Planctomycetota bacterium]